MEVKRIVILGSTGTIGVNTLKVVKRYPKKFKVVGLTAFGNVKKIAEQIKVFSPKYAAVHSEFICSLKKEIGLCRTKIIDVETDLDDLVASPQVDVVVIGMSSSAALAPFLSAVRAGKTVAPANKEALVVAGEIIMREAKKHGATVIPVDSEQSAIFQCLEGHGHNEIKRVCLTASGGALLKVAKSKFDSLSVADILNHPRWKMGKKITVDSATLMNKGFEVIEAMRLFSLDVKDIEVVVHPQAIIHSMVEFMDGSIIAQLGVTDMRIPIQYALTYPHRFCTGLKPMNFFELKELTFLKPDLKKFPSLSLACEVGKRGGTYPAVLNAADEVAVAQFLKGKIRFTKIYDIVEKIVLAHKSKIKFGLNDIYQADQWAREETRKEIKK